MVAAAAAALLVGAAAAAAGPDDEALEQTETDALHTLYGTFDPTGAALPDVPVPAGPWRLLADSARASYIVQFGSSITAAARQALVERGVRIRGYLPSDAFVVVATPAQMRAVGRLPSVRAVVAQPTLFKLHPSLVTTGSAGPRLLSAGSQLQADVRVEVGEPAEVDGVRAYVEARGGHVVRAGMLRGAAAGRLVRLRLAAADLAGLAALPAVTAVEPYTRPRLLNDVTYGVLQSATPFQGSIWGHGVLGQGQVVAVTDSGLDVHSCFFSPGKVAAYDDWTFAPDGDADGHGTHVAGTIAGDAGDNGRHDRHDGMAPGARLLIQDVAEGGDLTGIPDDIGSLFAAAYDKGARIHSNSWGGGDNSYDALARAVDAFVASHRDLLVLFANGNDGDQGDGSVRSPATAKNVVSVAAVDGLRPSVLATFSSRGPTADGRAKPTLVAPGVDIISAAAGKRCAVQSMSGTSMATPAVAGAAALVRQYFTAGFYPSGQARPADALQPSAALLKAMLLLGADDIGRAVPAARFPGRGQGFGRVHLDKALLFDDHARRLWVRDEGRGLQTDEVRAFAVPHHSGPLKVCLAWTDVPGTAGAQRAQVNDLDLTVTLPDGRIVRGNMQGRVGAALPHADHVNVEEVVHFTDAPAGRYVVTVRGTHVPLGPQSFALALRH